MAINYTSWPVEKLEREAVKIQKAIESHKKKNKKATLAKVKAVARQNGFELRELLEPSESNTNASAPPKGTNGKKRAKVMPKYQNPSKSDQRWTGRGRQPLWVKEYVEAGGSLESIAI